MFSFGNSFFTSGFSNYFWGTLLSVRPIGDLGLLIFFSGSLNVSKINPPFFKSPLIAAASVLENCALYGSFEANLLSLVKLLFYELGSLNCSSKLELYLGLKVFPRPYFSPLGLLGGVSPFWVGDPGYFCIFVIKSGEGGAVNAMPGCFEFISAKSFEIS